MNRVGNKQQEKERENKIKRFKKEDVDGGVEIVSSGN